MEKNIFVAQLNKMRKSWPSIVSNLKRNWYFPISAMAFFCLNVSLTAGYFLGLPIALVFSLIIAARVPSIWEAAKNNRMRYQIVSALTAAGICWGEQASLYYRFTVSSKAQVLEATLSIPIDFAECVRVIGAIGAIAALFFVYVCVLLFLKKFIGIIAETDVFKGAKFSEMIVYGLLILVTFTFIAIAFAKTKVFYGTGWAGYSDIIYTSDSSPLVKGNVYMVLTHSENDLRQPLFALFAAPFIGIPYLIGKLFGASETVQAVLMNWAQILMLFAANYMLARIMGLAPMKRICFMLLTCCTYTYLLFVLMMEQYIVAYFWLVLCLYLFCEKRRPDHLVLWGAGGTMLTSMVVLPFMPDKSPLKNFREWFADTVKYGLEFVVVMLVFCRFDVIFYFVDQITSYIKFSGKSISFSDRIFQYTTFIRNYFLAPVAGVDFSDEIRVSWQLNTISEISLAGVIILLLSIVSVVLNRDKRSSLLAAGWAFFSFVMLLCVGWGTAENGLILYALYFGWAFLVLLFQLIEKIEQKLNTEFLTPAITVGCVLFLVAVNIPAILELVDFGVTYYPV